MLEMPMYDWVYIYEFEGNIRGKVPALVDGDYIGFWEEGGYSFLFFKRDKKTFLQNSSLSYRSELVIRHEDWESGTSLDIFNVGRITIHPPWKNPPAPGEIDVCIDPCMAFGSGYHATTRGCLILIDRLFREIIPPRVLDLGTGTGILSIACLKMGASTAFCIDSNNLSTDTAKKNRSLNGLEKNMHLWRGDVRDFLHIQADLLIANLHFQVIDQITDQELFYLKNYYILSGLLGHEGELIEEKLKKRLHLLERLQENLWCSYLFRSIEAS
jgi:ribosomal protein L11 methyltransferase